METQDISDDLRDLAAVRAGDGPSGKNYDPELLGALTDAADEIEKLKTALREITVLGADNYRTSLKIRIDTMYAIALRVLSDR